MNELLLLLNQSETKNDRYKIYKKAISINELNKENLLGTNLKRIMSVTDTDIFLYQLKEAILIQDGLIIHNGIPLEDSFIRKRHVEMFISELSLDKTSDNNFIYLKNFEPVKLKGDYVSLLGPWDSTFWHWIVEYLTKVAISETCGFKGKYIVSPVQQFMHDSLLILGITENRIFITDKSQNFELENLFIIEKFPVYSGKIILSGLKILRDMILAHFDKSLENTKKRLYISRKISTNNRKVANESEVIKLLESYGFQNVIMENLTLKEQIELVANAECMVGGNGSGMLHCLFMLPRSLVIEFYSPTYTTPALWPSIELLCHNYHMFTSPNDGIYQYGTSLDASVFVSLDLLKVTLDNYFLLKDFK